MSYLMLAIALMTAVYLLATLCWPERWRGKAATVSDHLAIT